MQTRIHLRPCHSPRGLAVEISRPYVVATTNRLFRRFAVPPFLLFVLALCGTGCTSLSQSSTRLNAQQNWNGIRARIKCQLAQQHYDSGRFEKATQEALQSIELDKTNPDAFVLLSRAQQELGRFASAKRTLDAADRAELVSAELHYARGVLLEQRGRIEDALVAYTSAVKLDPEKADYLVARAECLVDLGRPLDALAMLDRGRAQVDEDGTLAALSALIASLLGDSAEATERYRRAHVAHPNNQLIAEELGRLLIASRRFEEAIAVLAPLVEPSRRDAPGADVVRNLALAHLATGNAKQAHALLTSSTKQEGRDSRTQLLLAKAAVATGDLMTALAALDAVKRRTPNDPELWIVRATTFFARGRYEAAATDLYNLLETHPDDVEANCLLAEVLLAQDRVEGARSYFAHALAVDPRCAWATEGLKDVARVDATRETIRASSKLTEATLTVIATPQTP